LGVVLNKNGDSKEEINNRAKKGSNIVRSLNAILRDQSVRKMTKKIMNKTVVQRIMCGAEGSGVNRGNRNKQQPKRTAYERDK
jgi:hypothetical protein